jgi:hypothetical protein
LFHMSAPSPSITAATKYYLSYGHNQMLASQPRYRVHSVFYEFIANSNIVVSSHHTIAIKPFFGVMKLKGSRSLVSDKGFSSKICFKCLIKR